MIKQQKIPLYIKGYIDDNDCFIEITDAGRGMTEEVNNLYKKQEVD